MACRTCSGERGEKRMPALAPATVTLCSGTRQASIMRCLQNCETVMMRRTLLANSGRSLEYQRTNARLKHSGVSSGAKSWIVRMWLGCDKGPQPAGENKVL